MGTTRDDLHFDDSQDLIRREKLFELFEISPEFATINGYHALDDQLSHVDRPAIEAEHRFFKDWLADLDKIPVDQLSADQQLDRDLFRHYFALHSFSFDEVQLWKHNPDAITGVSQICFLQLLYSEGSMDDEERFGQLASRLEQLPRYVTEFKSHLETPPRRWVDITLQTTAGTPLFFDAIRAAAADKVSPTLLARIEGATTQAKAEVENYITWLKGKPCDDSEAWVLGEDRFAELIRLRNLGLDVQEILDLGEYYLKRFEKEHIRLARELVGKADIPAARVKVEADAPTDFPAALEATRNACNESKAFLMEHHLMDLPQDEELRVLETPEFLRPLIPFAAIFPPAKFATRQIGSYIVTPPATPQGFAKHLNRTALYNTAVHEGYPGHHLQLSTSNRECSIMRSAPPIGGKSTELVEGWAHYCEELMKNRGFQDTTAGRFIMVGDLIWRATRILVDVKLSQGNMSYEEGVSTLVDKARMSREGAMAEVNRYTYSPSYQLSYLIGKHLIMQLKADVERKEGKDFSETAFHNRLLHAGTMPISFIRKHIFSL